MGEESVGEAVHLNKRKELEAIVLDSKNLTRNVAVASLSASRADV